MALSTLDCTPLLDVLAANSKSLSSKALFSFLDDKGNISKGYTYSEFDQVTSKLASALVAPKGWNIKGGSKVLLVYPPGIEFIVAFMACLKANVIAVPVYPPRPGFSKDLNMFVSVVSNCGAEIALTNSSYNLGRNASAFKSFLTRSAAKWPRLKWLVTSDNKVPDSPKPYSEVVQAPRPETVAFFQYTSGSTSAPKGVQVTHGNLAHNLASIVYALEASESTIVVSWLPQYHDMGLIGSYLGILRCGGSGYYMSPVSFIKNPPYWLQMVSKFRATHIQAPNFAYKLTLRKFKDRKLKPADLDLSCLEHCFNAAEPIEIDAMDSFNKYFAASKLSKSAMSPGYGLAEHTVYVCDRGQQRVLVDRKALEKERKVIVEVDDSDHSKTQWIVGCGNPHRFSNLSDIQVRIVDEESFKVLPDDSVGEIWVWSHSKAAGYYGMEEKTKADFKAQILDSSDEKDLELNWLRTGDLGFIHETELFICGRIKDLIIIRGRNHYPQDIEHTVEQCDPAVRPGCVAAFTVSDSEKHGEYLGIVAEIRADNKSMDLDGLSSKLRKSVAGEHGIMPHVCILIKQKSIPKTTSGKISRYRARLGYENSELDELHRFVGASKEQRQVEEDVALKFAKDEVDNQEAVEFVEIGSAKDPKTGGGSKLSGDALLESLKEEVARLMEADSAGLDANIPLNQLGLDSMGLVQLKGILNETYDTDVEEVEMFDDETTLAYLQRRCEGESPLPKFVAGESGASAAAGGGSDRKPKAKPAQRKQSLFGCFKICGC